MTRKGSSSLKMTKLSEQTISISSIIVSRPIIYIAVIVVIFTITIVINQMLMYSMHLLQYMMTCVLPVYLRLIGSRFVVSFAYQLA